MIMNLLKFIKSLFRRLSKYPSVSHTVVLPSGYINEETPVPRDMLDWDLLLNMCRDWEAIVWHHSLTDDKIINDWEGITRYHTSYRIDANIVTKEIYEERKRKGLGGHFEKPWSDIGYHFGIEKEGLLYRIKVGRPLDRSGAHCTQKKMNSRALGICIVGEYDTHYIEKEKYNLCIKLGKEIMRHIPKITPGHNYYHNQFAHYKSCPGKLFPTIDKFREDLSFK